MLAPGQVRGGTFADAQGLTLVLPREEFESVSLIVPEGDGHRVIFLDDRFGTFNCTGNSYHTGLLIGGIAIELDPDSAFDARSRRVLGSLVRVNAELQIVATPEERLAGTGTVRPTIQSGLPECAEGQPTGFARWQIVVGEGLSKQVLLIVDRTQPSKAQ